MSNWFNQRSIRVQIFLLVLTVTLPITAIMLWQLDQHLRDEKTEAHEKAGMLANISVTRLQNYLNRNQRMLRQIAAHDGIKAMDRQACHDSLSDFGRLQAEFINLTLHDRQGMPVCAVNPALAAPQAQAQAQALSWPEAARSKAALMIGPLEKTRSRQRWSSSLAYPVFDNHGALQGFLSLDVDLVNLSNIVLTGIPTHTNVTVLDDKNRILLHATDPEKQIGQTIPPALATLLRQTRPDQPPLTPLPLLKFGGQPDILAMLNLPTTNWQVVASIPLEHELADYKRRMRQGIASALLALLLSAILAWRITRTIIRPIARLAEAASSVAMGQLDTRASLEGPREIVAVAQQLNSMLDLRDQKDAALQESRALLENIINSTDAYIFAFDQNNRFTLINHAMADFHGMPKEALLGKFLHEVFRPEVADKLAAENHAIMHSGVATSRETILPRRKDGTPHYMISSKFALRDAHGKVIGLGGVATDITELKQAELALKTREAQNRALLNAIPDLIFTNRRDGEYLAVHAADPAMLLLPPERFLHLKPTDVLPAPVAALMMQGIARTLDENTTQELNYELPINGQTRHFEARIAPSDTDTVISIVRDVTSHKQAEHALQSSLREKMALLNEVHHRVKNNLQVITSLLRLEAARSTQNDTMTVLNDMQGRVRAMALLHEALYRTGNFAAIDLSEYLKQLANQVFRSLNLHPDTVQLQLDLAPVSSDLELATPCGLLVNELLTNCLMHAFPGERSGEVCIRLEKIKPGSKLRLTISDNGVGLPANFETRRADSLGMQLVSDLAQQLGGTLEIHSGAGTRCSVDFHAELLHSSARDG